MRELAMRLQLFATSAVWLLAAGDALAQPTTATNEIELPKVEAFRLERGMKLGIGPAKENSGIVMSRQWPDVFWMHNDSGDEPRIYAVRRDGSVYPSDRYGAETPGTLVGGAINVDWEDITTDSLGHLIVADFGNNENNRRDLVLYYLLEPAPTAGRTACFRRVFFRYPQQRQFPAQADDFNYDAEAIFTIDDQVYVLTKHRSDTRTTLYHFDPAKWRDDEVSPLELVDRFELHGQATAADATADGRRLVVATYKSFWLFEIEDQNQPLRGRVSWLPFTGVEEVEAVCFADDETLLAADEKTAQLFEVPLSRFFSVKATSR
jgi:hypothetical protein